MRKKELKRFIYRCIGLLVLLTFRFVQMPVFDHVDEINQFVGDTVKIGGRAEKTYVKNNQFRAILSNVTIDDQYIHSSLLILLPRNQIIPTGSQVTLQGHISLFSDLTNNPLEERIVVASVFYPIVDSVTEESSTVRSYVVAVQSHILSKTGQILPEPHAALLAGILFGVEAEMTENFKNNLIYAGLIHIVVASGFNALIVSSVVLKLTIFLPNKIKIVTYSCLMLIYVGITGFQIPILRAAIMTLGTVLAQISGENKQSLWWLFLSAYILLLYKPQWLFSLSFQLSFLASFGIILTSGLFERLFRLIPGIIRQDTATTFSAQLFTVPVLYFYFQKVTLFGYVSNPLILWTIAPIMYLGFFAFIAAFLSRALGRIFALPVWFLLDVVINFTNFISKYG